jgi:hypothetical protein
MRYKKLIITIFFSCTIYIVNAQNYNNAIGLRIGGNSNIGGVGVDYKHFFNESKAINVLFAFKDPVGFGATYQVHNNLNQLEGLQWFYGGGAYLTFAKPNGGFGLLGNIGLEYSFSEVPINIAIDWKPEFALAPSAGIDINTFGFTIRVALDKK